MKVLIVGVARTGTTSLLEGITKQKYQRISEPYNTLFRDTILTNPLKGIQDKAAVKCLIDQLPDYSISYEDYYTSFSKNFDKIILLDRKNYKEHWVSFVNLILKNKIKLAQRTTEWPQHFKWNEREISKFDFDNVIKEGWLTNFHKQKIAINKLSENIAVPITYYEDLYNLDIEQVTNLVCSWGLDLDSFSLVKFLDPSKKYKQPSNKTLI